MLWIAVCLFAGVVAVLAWGTQTYRRAVQEHAANGQQVEENVRRLERELVGNTHRLIDKLANDHDTAGPIRTWQEDQMKLPIPPRPDSEPWYKTTEELAKMRAEERTRRHDQVNRQAMIRLASGLVTVMFVCGMTTAGIYHWWSAPPALDSAPSADWTATAAMNDAGPTSTTVTPSAPSAFDSVSTDVDATPTDASSVAPADAASLDSTPSATTTDATASQP